MSLHRKFKIGLNNYIHIFLCWKQADSFICISSYKSKGVGWGPQRAPWPDRPDDFSEGENWLFVHANLNCRTRYKYKLVRSLNLYQQESLCRHFYEEKTIRGLHYEYTHVTVLLKSKCGPLVKLHRRRDPTGNCWRRSGAYADPTWICWICILCGPNGFFITGQRQFGFCWGGGDYKTRWQISWRKGTISWAAACYGLHQRVVICAYIYICILFSLGTYATNKSSSCNIH